MVRSGTLIRTLNHNPVTMAISADGQRLALGNTARSPPTPVGSETIPALRASIDVVDALSGKLLYAIEAHDHQIHALAFSPDDRFLLSGSRDKTIKLWDAASGTLVRTFVGHSDHVTSIAFFPDGQRIFSSSNDKTIRLWDANTGELLRTVTHHSEGVGTVTLSPDGETAASGSDDGTVLVWETTGERIVHTLTGHVGRVNSLAFSRDGHSLLSASGDGTLRLWDLTRTSVAKIFQGHSSGVMSAAFSPDGTRIVSASQDTTVSIWNVASGTMLARLLGGRKDDAWLTITPSGFLAGSRMGVERSISIVRRLDVATVEQVQQSLFNPDLVREALGGDPAGEVKRAAEVVDLEKVIDSGPAPFVEITSHASTSISDKELVTVTARINDGGKGIGRIEWRVNGITAGVCRASTCLGPNNAVKQQLALDPGENTIEVTAYNARDLLASLPARTTVTFTGPADKVKPKLHILAIGINSYVDKGWAPKGQPWAMPRPSRPS